MAEAPPIHVSGAGPAGLAAALAANRAGRQVIVHERAADVGHRFHDDFQGLENWTTDGDALDELASLGIAATFDHTPIGDVVVFDPRGRAHSYRSPRPFFYVVRRGPGPGTLDSSLKAQALAQGIEIRFSEARHQADDGIVADGPHRANAIVVGHVFATNAADGVYAALSDGLAPGGYAYLIVVQGRGTVAACMFRDFRNERTYLERTVAFFQEHVGCDMTAPRRFGGTASIAAPAGARRGNALLVGEAAGFQDALWGFGMRYAMVSGGLAARSLVAGRPEEYRRLWQERLGGLLRTGVVNRFILGSLGDRGYLGLAWLLDRAADPRVWLGRQYRPSLLKTLLAPMAQMAVRNRSTAGGMLS